MLDRIRQLDYVVVLCDDITAMKTFYRDIMGFSIYTDLREWVEFRTGSTLLALRPRGRPYDGPAVAAESAAVQLAFRVARREVDRCYEELKGKGVSILEAPTDQGWGHRTLFFRDPEGNVLEIYADL